MIKELDRVVLTTDVVDYDLKAGDVGTVVMVHREGEGFEVEFMALNGETIAVVTGWRWLLPRALGRAQRRPRAHWSSTSRWLFDAGSRSVRTQRRSGPTRKRK